MMKLSIKKLLICTISFLLAAVLTAEVLPLRNFGWDNEVFRQRFLGTYGINAEIEPTISREESELFSELIPMMQNNQVEEALTLIDNFVANSEEGYSAAIDYTRGNIFFQESKLEQATKHYEAAIKKFPTFARAYENLGRLHVMNAQYSTAKNYLVQAIELGGAQADLYGLLGYCYLNLQKPSTSLVAYNSAILLDPDNFDWQLGRAQALVQTDRTQEAISFIKELLEIKPEEKNLIQTLANSYLSDQKYLESAKYLELLNRLGQATPSSLMLLGDLYMNENLPQLASPVYAKAIEADTKIELASALRIANTFVERSLYDEAESFIKKIKNEYSDSFDDRTRIRLLNLNSTIAIARNENDAAMEQLGQILEMDPMNGDALISLGNLNWNTGDLETAEYYFQRAQKIDSVKLKALLNNGRLLVEQKKFNEAIKLLNQAYQIRPSENLRDYISAVESVLERR